MVFKRSTDVLEVWLEPFCKRQKNADVAVFLRERGMHSLFPEEHHCSCAGVCQGSPTAGHRNIHTLLSVSENELI